MTSKERFEAFEKAMGDPNMPDCSWYATPSEEYDRWLFDYAWQTCEAKSAARIAQLEGALQFYADGGHYTEIHEPDYTTGICQWVKHTVINDRGETAQKALTNHLGE